MNLISTHDFNFHPLCVRWNIYNFSILVNSQMQCSHVIQTQAQKCDGMHINVVAVYQRASKFARETSKTQTAFIGSIFSDKRNPPFWCADAHPDAQFILLRILRSSKYIKNTLINLCIWFSQGSAHVKICVWIKAGPQPLFPAEPGVKKGWADRNYISRFELIQTPYFTWT